MVIDVAVQQPSAWVVNLCLHRGHASWKQQHLIGGGALVHKRQAVPVWGVKVNLVANHCCMPSNPVLTACVEKQVLMCGWGHTHVVDTTVCMTWIANKTLLPPTCCSVAPSCEQPIMIHGALLSVQCSFKQCSCLMQLCLSWTTYVSPMLMLSPGRLQKSRPLMVCFLLLSSSSGRDTALVQGPSTEALTATNCAALTGGMADTSKSCVCMHDSVQHMPCIDTRDRQQIQ